MTSLTTGSPSTTTSSAGVAPYAVPYAQQNLANSWAMSQQPYQAYTGQQNAAFTDMQNQAFNQASNMGVSPQTYSASNAAQQATNNLLGAQYNPMQLNYSNVTAPQLQQYQMQQPQNVYTRNFTDPGVAQQYMNPYIQQSLNPQEQALAQQQAGQGTQLDAQATRAGAFGGSRAGLQQVAQNAANQNAMSSLIGTGMNNAYNNAQQQFNAEQGIGLQGQMANQQMGYNTGAQNLGANLAIQQLGAGQNLTAQQLNQANQMGANQQAIGQQQYGAGLNLATNQGALSGANTLGTLGQNQYGQQVGNIGLLNQLGNQQQQYQQGLLNTQYQNYVNQKNYPYQQAGFFQNMVNGYPVQSGTSTTQPSSPSYLQNAAALGVGAYGLSQMFPNLGSGISNYLNLSANGGLMKSYKKGGMVKRYADQGLTSISSALGPSLTSDPVMLQKEISAAQARGDIQTANALQAELTQQQYITKQAQGLQAAPQAGSYGANPQTAANLAGNGSGQQKMPVPPADTSNSMQGLPSITDLIKMQKDAEKIQHKAAKNPGQMAIADNAAYANAISDAALSNDALPSEPSLPSAPGTYKSGGITEVARYADNGVTTSGDSLPADIQKADMGDNSLDLGAPSTLNTVRENRGLSAVPVGQVQDVPNQQILQQANAETQQLRQAQAQPSTPRQMANDMMSNFVQHTPLTAEERISTSGGAPTFDYQSLRDELAKQKLASSDSLRQGRGLAALAAAGAMLEGNQFGRGVGQAATAFGSSYGNALSANQKAQENLVAMNMKLSQAEHADKLGLYKTKVEAVNAAQKDAQEYDKNRATLFKDIYTATKENQIKAPEQASAAINAYKANPTSENRKMYEAAVEYLTLTHPAVIAANVNQGGANARNTATNETQLTKEQEEIKAKAIADAKKIFMSPLFQGAKKTKPTFEKYMQENGNDLVKAQAAYARDVANSQVPSNSSNTGTSSSPNVTTTIPNPLNTKTSPTISGAPKGTTLGPFDSTVGKYKVLDETGKQVGWAK